MSIRTHYQVDVQYVLQLMMLCYMSKRTYGHVLVLLGPRLVRPAADDEFVIIRKNNIKTFLIFCVTTALKEFFLLFQSIRIMAYT